MDRSVFIKIAASLCVSLGFASSVHAIPIKNYTIWDNINDSNNQPTSTENQYSYWGGDSHGYGDVIGAANKFDIQKAVINRTDNTLTIDIHTGFVTNDGLGSYRNLTSSGNGIALGDLFLTTNWNPSGTPENHFQHDNLSNTDTTWNYVLSLGDKRWKPDSNPDSDISDAILYEITSPDSYLTSQHFLSRGTYRNGQLIAVDRTKDGLTDTQKEASWTSSTTPGVISFVMEIDGLAGLKDGPLGMHWTMSCGNDVIEGDPPVNVPEPASWSLLWLGLIGISAMKLRTPKQKIN